MDPLDSILTQLHHAVQSGRFHQIERIIERGFTHRKLRLESFNLLCSALKSGKTDIAHLLLDHGCSVNSTTKGVQTPLHLAIEIDAEDTLISKLLNKGASKTTLDSYGSIPLHLAAIYGRTSIVKLLIQPTTLLGSSQHYINSANRHGMTALQLAVEGQHYEVAALLLEKRADPDKIDQNGITAIHRAAMVGNEKIFKLLANHANISVHIHTKLHGETILHHAIQGGSIGIVQHIFQNCVVDKDSFPDLLSIALKSESENAEQIQEILIKLGFRCTANDIYDTSLVFNIIKRGYTELFEDLLELGLDPNMPDSYSGDGKCVNNSLLDTAAFFLQKDIAELLLARGAYVNIVNNLGRTPLSAALLGIVFNRKKELHEKSLNTIELLLKQGVGSNRGRARHFFKFFPLPFHGGIVDIVSLLLDYDVNPDNFLACGDCRTALQRASSEGVAEIVKLLLSNGADVTVLDGNDRSIFQSVQQSRIDFENSDWVPIRVSQEEIMTLLTQHVVKIQTADLLPKTAFLRSYTPPPDPSYQEICSRELINLKKDYFAYPLISFYAILTATQDDLIRNLTEEMFENIINSDILMQYPVYEDLIRGKVKKAARRRKLIDEYSVILCGIFASLPQNCVCKILSFLNNQQIRCLICLSKIKLSSEEWARRESYRKEAESRGERFEKRIRRF